MDAVPAGSTYQAMCPTGWTSGGGTRLISSTDTAWGGGGAPSGSNYLGIQSSTACMSQQLQLPSPTVTLMLQFTTRNRPYDTGTGTAYLKISLDGTAVWNAIPPTTWTTYTQPITATGNSAPVLEVKTIYSSGLTDVTIEIDNILLCNSSFYSSRGGCYGR